MLTLKSREPTYLCIVRTVAAYIKAIFTMYSEQQWGGGGRETLTVHGRIELSHFAELDCFCHAGRKRQCCVEKYIMMGESKVQAYLVKVK